MGAEVNVYFSPECGKCTTSEAIFYVEAVKTALLPLQQKLAETLSNCSLELHPGNFVAASDDFRIRVTFTFPVLTDVRRSSSDTELLQTPTNLGPSIYLPLKSTLLFFLWKNNYYSGHNFNVINLDNSNLIK